MIIDLKKIRREMAVGVDGTGTEGAMIIFREHN
jgi:hypothetical protein